MGQRLELQALLVEILGTTNVYFQPPENVLMKYPCIRYERDSDQTEHADNKPYKRRVRYLVTVIHQDPDNMIVPKLAELPLCRFDRHYKADQLNHDVFKLFF